MPMLRQYDEHGYGFLGHRVFFYQVKSLRQFGAVLLLLVSCVAPAMACMAPDAQMTVEEQACCRMMKSQCGQMEMPASHDCCTKTPVAACDNALKTDMAAFYPAVFVTLWVSSFDLLAPHAVAEDWLQRPEHSPPKSPPSIISSQRV
jgi:hypothetical protein